MQAIEEGRVKREAEIGERAQTRGVIRVAGGKHSGGGGRSFRERHSLIEDGDTMAEAVEFEGKREAHDACASNTDIGVVHITSLVLLEKSCGQRGVSLRD